MRRQRTFCFSSWPCTFIGTPWKNCWSSFTRGQRNWLMFFSGSEGYLRGLCFLVYTEWSMGRTPKPPGVPTGQAGKCATPQQSGHISSECPQRLRHSEAPGVQEHGHPSWRHVAGEYSRSATPQWGESKKWGSFRTCLILLSEVHSQLCSYSSPAAFADEEELYFWVDFSLQPGFSEPEGEAGLSASSLLSMIWSKWRVYSWDRCQWWGSGSYSVSGSWWPDASNCVCFEESGQALWHLRTQDSWTRVGCELYSAMPPHQCLHRPCGLYFLEDC